MRLLVTGGAGFIGANFVHRTVADRPDVDVTVLDKLTYAGNRASLDPVAGKITFVHGDIADPPTRRPSRRERRPGGALRRRVAQRQLAGRPRPRSCTPTSSARSRCSKPCARYDVRYHHISTDEVYGDLALDDPAKFTEATPYNPSSPYSSTKASADLFVRAWVRSFGLRRRSRTARTTTGRISMWRSSFRGRSPMSSTECGRGCTAAVPTCATGFTSTTTTVRCGTSWTGPDPGDVSDRRGRRNRQPHGRRDRARTVRHGPGGVRFRHRPAGARPALCNRCDAVAHELGWEPQYRDFRSGLAATIEWYRSHETWWMPQKTATEAAYERSERILGG